MSATVSGTVRARFTPERAGSNSVQTSESEGALNLGHGPLIALPLACERLSCAFGPAARLGIGPVDRTRGVRF